MKSRFQLCKYQRAHGAGWVRIHARLKALRGDSWATVGVFQLSEEEWDELAQVCEERGVEVIYDVEESTIPA